jgi:hypothetical protein
MKADERQQMSLGCLAPLCWHPAGNHWRNRLFVVVRGDFLQSQANFLRAPSMELCSLEANLLAVVFPFGSLPQERGASHVLLAS